MTSFSRQLARSPTSVRVARRFVDDHTTTFTSQRKQEDTRLLVSELVSNALLHGTGAIGLRVDVETGMVRVEVSDQGNVSVAPSPTPGAHGGWGLRIVEQLADEWGVLEGSTKVWFRLKDGS
jgi:anti-sigma regulatory factor (Ser/Thr protein kinase)